MFGSAPRWSDSKSRPRPKTLGPRRSSSATARGLPTDLVILSIGVKPEVELARTAGVDVGELGGIRVNQHMRTNDEHIWAVGDAIEVQNPVTHDWSLLPLAGPANRQGRVAADNVMGRTSRYRGTWGTSVVRVFDLTIAATGLNERQLRRAGIAFESVHVHPLSHVGYYPGADLLDMKLVFSAEDGTIYGAQVVGDESAARRIDVLATAIQGGMSVDDVAQLELCYAPAYGAPKDPVNLLAMAARNVVNDDVGIAHWHEVDELGEDEVLLDVRSAEEREVSVIPGSMHIPLDELRGRLDELDTSKRFIVHCFSGQRSYFASGCSGFVVSMCAISPAGSEAGRPPTPTGTARSLRPSTSAHSPSRPGHRLRHSFATPCDRGGRG